MSDISGMEVFSILFFFLYYFLGANFKFQVAITAAIYEWFVLVQNKEVIHSVFFPMYYLSLELLRLFLTV